MAASTSTASKDREERQKNQNQNVANTIKKDVKKKLGLTATMGGYIATNLEGKDKLFYGEEASKFTDDALVQNDIAKVGNYFKKVGGEFIRISKSEGEKLYAAGDPSISRSIIGNKRTTDIKYGSSGSAMGSGDPTGVMTSVPISSAMLQQQNKFLGLAKAGMSFAMPGLAKTVMRADAGKNLYDAANPTKAVNQYDQKFTAAQKGKKFTSDRNIIGLLGLKQDKKTKKDTLGN